MTASLQGWLVQSSAPFTLSVTYMGDSCILKPVKIKQSIAMTTSMLAGIFELL